MWNSDNTAKKTSQVADQRRSKYQIQRDKRTKQKKKKNVRKEIKEKENDQTIPS